MVRRLGEDHKEVTEVKPRWTLATPCGDVALCPAVVQTREQTELRE